MDIEKLETRLARQRASVKWLLSKAFNNRVPDNLKEPFYRDHENQERLKPQIIVDMGNATLYCQTLSNLYSDPNYQSLNHWAILQTLTRKGINISELPEMPITETVLIQINPIRINAHMCVIESLMNLYAKEILSGDRVPIAIKRISRSHYKALPDQNCEQLLLAWISHSCIALKRRISQEIEVGAFEDENGVKLQIPNIPPLRDFQDICDGVCLAFLISYYCPKVLTWTSVRVNYLPAVEDSIHNVLLVSNFSQKHLPYSVFHMTPEDITYMRGSMKLNLVVMLADLFNLFEVNPAKCVCYPGKDIQGYVVHKSRGVPTLSSIHSQINQQQQEPLVPALLRQPKEKNNMETKADERGDSLPAGRPSNWEQGRRPSYGGRRSRRNSSSEDSQLTIENFGGSQEHLNSIGRSFDRDRDRKLSSTSFCGEPAVALRSSIADARGTLQLGYDTDSGSEKQDRETEKFLLKHQGSNSSIPISYQHTFDKSDGSNCEKTKQQSNISWRSSMISPMLYSSTDESVSKKLPSICSTFSQLDDIDTYVEDHRAKLDVSKLSNIREKLEEKRKRIEEDKLKIEMALASCHQEKERNTDFEAAIESKEGFENSSDAIRLDKPSNDAKRSWKEDQDEVDKHQTIFEMNSNLQDIQEDIQKLVTHQSEMQAQQLQVRQLMQAQQISNLLNKHPYSSQQHIADHLQHRVIQQPQNFGSAPHLPQSYDSPVSAYNSRPPSHDVYLQQLGPQSIQYINEHGQYVNHNLQNSPSLLTAAQFYMPQQNLYLENAAPLPYNNVSYGRGPSGSVLHYISDTCGYYQKNPHNMQQLIKRDNDYSPPRTLTRDSRAPDTYSLKNSSSLQSNYHHRPWIQSTRKYENLQCLQPMVDVNAWQLDNNAHTMESFADRQDASKSPEAIGLQSSSDDIMAPQSICFIGDEEDVEEIERNIIESLQSAHLSNYKNHDDLHQNHQNTVRSNSSEEFENEIVNKLNISSGNLTYRMPSPSRPLLNDPRNVDSFKEKGFYISFDDDLPVKPKPPLRSKRSSIKEKSGGKEDNNSSRRESLSQFHNPLSENDTIQRNSFDGNSFENNKATYNKYTDNSIQPKQFTKTNHVFSMANSNFNNSDRRHLEDLTNQEITHSPTQQKCPPATNQSYIYQNEKVLVVDSDVTSLDHNSMDEMERRKEKIMLLSLQRRQQQEETKARKEIEANQRRENERRKDEERARKKEEQVARRTAILERHRLKKAIEEAEREGKNFDRSEKSFKHKIAITSAPRLRQQKGVRPRPKTIHVDAGSAEISQASKISGGGKKDSNTHLAESLGAGGRTFSRISIAKGSSLSFRGRKSNSLMNLCDTDSGLGRSTPPRRAPSPGVAFTGRQMPTPSGPGSLPPGLVSKRQGFDDGSSDVSSTPNSMMEYSGPKLYKQPEAKSNRGIILNAVEYCVFPGAVNRDAKQKVLEKIAGSEAKHFLVLFRDAGCQFRAMYSYTPEKDQVYKLYGTGPSHVDEVMFDKFFKYNSGGKCFSQVHTKHLTVTIDAFTIHNSLWQGKKTNLLGKKDLALVI